MNNTQTTPTPPAHGKLPRNVSAWSTRDKFYRIVWATVALTLFRCSFHDWYGIRAGLLKLFGAKIGRNLRIRRTARIELPFNLTIGDDVIIGDGSILYALGPITIGDRALISQYVHLCAGTHDHRSRHYPLLKPPITIGADTWLAAEVFIGPGVTIGDRSVVGARASVFRDVPPDVIVGGNPAKIIKARILID